MNGFLAYDAVLYEILVTL